MISLDFGFMENQPYASDKAAATSLGNPDDDALMLSELRTIFGGIPKPVTGNLIEDT